MTDVWIENSNLDPKMATALAKFIKFMVQKLEKNKHKDPVRETDIPTLLRLMMGELGEFLEEWMNTAGSEKSDLELADVANFAFLIFMALED